MKLKAALIAALVIASIGLGGGTREAVAGAPPAECLAGTYNVTNGFEPCTPAAAGRYASSDGATTDVPCAPGSYQNETGQSECKLAPAGSFTDISEAIDFTLCPTGSWQENSGATGCTPADPGTFVPVEGSFVPPTPCPLGFWQDAFSASSCKPALAGQFVGVIASTGVTDCSVGKYQPLQGQSECIDAPAGSFVMDTGRADFTLCPVGRWQDESGQIECKQAGPGTFVAEKGRSLPPTPCPKGFYQGAFEATSCIPADPGRFVAVEGSPGPALPCAIGEYQPSSGQESCIVSPAGATVSTTGAIDFTVCLEGTYQPLTGQMTCLDAPPGSFVNTQQAETPTPCSPGTLQPDTAKTSCIDAAPGTYVPAAGGRVAIDCELGTYQPEAGKPSCIDSPAGTYVDTKRAIGFVPCIEGTYQPDTAKTSCLDAPAGTFVNTRQASAATPCAPGTYQPETKKTSCIDAPPGAFAAGDGGTLFTSCSPGSYQPTAGSPACRLADANYFVAGSSARSQTPCAQNFTTNGKLGATTCVVIVPPTLTVPANITIQTNEADGRVVTFEVLVTDDVDGAILTCSKTSGAKFAVGATVVNCEAADRSATSSFASFTVTVEFVPRFVTGVAPARLLETRLTSPTVDGQAQGLDRLPAGNRLRVNVAGRAGVANDAKAVVINVTAIAPSAVGYITIHPCLDTVPTASSLNYAQGRTAGNEIIAQLDASGSICIFNSAETHLAIDVVAQVPASSNYAPVAPARLTDSRSTGSTVDGAEQGGGPKASGTTTIVVARGRGGVATDAKSVVVNITAIRPETAGYATVHPCLDETPLTASLNFQAGLTRGSEIIAELDSAGRICVFIQGSAHLTVDVVGQLAGLSDFASTGPARLLDSRPTGITIDGRQQAVGSIPAGGTLTVDATYVGGPQSPDGLVANITAIRPNTAGFLTVWNCIGDPPLASSLNFGPGDVVGNDLIIEANSSGKICVYASTTTSITIDAVGYRTSVT